MITAVRKECEIIPVIEIGEIPTQQEDPVFVDRFVTSVRDRTSREESFFADEFARVMKARSLDFSNDHLEKLMDCCRLVAGENRSSVDQYKRMRLLILREQRVRKLIP